MREEPPPIRNKKAPQSMVRETSPKQTSNPRHRPLPVHRNARHRGSHSTATSIDDDIVSRAASNLSKTSLQSRSWPQGRCADFPQTVSRVPPIHPATALEFAGHCILRKILSGTPRSFPPYDRTQCRRKRPPPALDRRFNAAHQRRSASPLFLLSGLSPSAPTMARTSYSFPDRRRS